MNAVGRTSHLRGRGLMGTGFRTGRGTGAVASKHPYRKRGIGAQEL